MNKVYQIPQSRWNQWSYELELDRVTGSVRVSMQVCQMIISALSVVFCEFEQVSAVNVTHLRNQSWSVLKLYLQKAEQLCMVDGRIKATGSPLR